MNLEHIDQDMVGRMIADAEKRATAEHEHAIDGPSATSIREHGLTIRRMDSGPASKSRPGVRKLAGGITLRDIEVKGVTFKRSEPTQTAKTPSGITIRRGFPGR